MPMTLEEFRELKRKKQEAVADIQRVTEIPKVRPMGFKEGFMKDLPENIGGMMGEIIGGRLAGRPGATVGAAAGGGLARAAEIGTATLGLGRETLPPGFPGQPNIKDILKSITAAGGEQAGYAAAGQYVLPRVVPPLIKGVTEEAKAAMSLLQNYMPRGMFSRIKKVPLTWAEATEGTILDFFDNISKKSIIGSTVMKRFAKGQAQALETVTNKFIDRLGTYADPVAIGNAFEGAIRKLWEPSRLLAQEMYNQVGEMVGGEFVEGKIVGGVRFNIQGLKEIAKREMAALKEIGGGIELRTAGLDLMKKVLRMEDDISYQATRELRTGMRKAAEAAEAVQKGTKRERIAKIFETEADKITMNTLEKTGNRDAIDLYREADRIWKEGHQLFNRKFLRGLVRQADPDRGGNPEGLVRAIFKKRSVVPVEDVKAALGVDKEAIEQLYGEAGLPGKVKIVLGENSTEWRKMKRWLVEEVVAGAQGSGRQIYNQLFGRTGYGERMLKVVYTPDEFLQLKRIAETYKLLEEKGAGTGSMWIQLAQGAAAGAWFIGRGSVAESALILLGPAGLALTFTNPILGRIMLKGMRYPRGAKELLPLADRFMAEYAKAVIREKNREGELTRMLGITPAQ